MLWCAQIHGLEHGDRLPWRETRESRSEFRLESPVLPAIAISSLQRAPHRCPAGFQEVTCAPCRYISPSARGAVIFTTRQPAVALAHFGDPANSESAVQFWRVGDCVHLQLTFPGGCGSSTIVGRNRSRGIGDHVPALRVLSERAENGVPAGAREAAPLGRTYRLRLCWRARAIRTPDGVVGPLPFRQPVSTAPAAALEFHHAPPALGTNQINDRGDYARVGFSWQRFDDSHGHLLFRRRCLPGRTTILRMHAQCQALERADQVVDRLDSQRVHILAEKTGSHLASDRRGARHARPDPPGIREMFRGNCVYCQSVQRFCSTFRHLAWRLLP